MRPRHGYTRGRRAFLRSTGTGFAYDGNGNPTTYASATCSYDVENHLTGYGNSLTAGYRGDGKRAWKDNGTSKTYYLYDSDKLLAEYGSNGTVTAALSWGPAGLLACVGTQYQFDQQGNVVSRIDTNGQLLSTHWFDAHGTEQTTASSEPFGYKGQFGYYTDRETGLILCTHQYLGLEGGRWLTMDPIEFSGGVNLYSYCANRVIVGADPSGLFLPLVGAAGGAACYLAGALVGGEEIHLGKLAWWAVLGALGGGLGMLVADGSITVGAGLVYGAILGAEGGMIDQIIGDGAISSGNDIIGAGVTAGVAGCVANKLAKPLGEAIRHRLPCVRPETAEGVAGQAIEGGFGPTVWAAGSLTGSGRDCRKSLG